ncbi:uncharacterized protein [Miscanthus floridulus]
MGGQSMVARRTGQRRRRQGDAGCGRGARMARAQGMLQHKGGRREHGPTCRRQKIAGKALGACGFTTRSEWVRFVLFRSREKTCARSLWWRRGERRRVGDRYCNRRRRRPRPGARSSSGPSPATSTHQEYPSASGFRRRMYGRRASQLLKEIDSSEAGQLVPFNTDVLDQVIRECSEHNSQFQSLIRKMVEQNLDIETTRNEDHYGAAIHHLSLLRNKRCLMAYMYNRAEVIQSFRWKVGPVLPHDIQEKLHFSEKEYFKNHSAAIKSYISEMDIDLTVDMVPPKDPYIQVRVLEDIGEVSLGDHSVSLTKNSLHFLRRTDAEQFISQGLMEEFLE